MPPSPATVRAAAAVQAAEAAVVCVASVLSAIDAAGGQSYRADSGIALTLIGMPFMVRTVQPALAEVQSDLESAAEILGASRFYVFRRIILPIVVPAMLTGFALAFARAVGEYGSVIFIAGNLPFKTEITPVLIVIRLEEYDYHGAASLGCVMLSVSFLGLWAINHLQSWRRNRFAEGGR